MHSKLTSKVTMQRTIDETLAGRNLFITGGTGFLGRVLVEKLLRSCPSIGKIYLLMRPKKGRSLEERLEQMEKLQLFEKLHELYPGKFREQVVAINGDATEVNLGISEEDAAMLRRNVHIVYHSAAAVKFNQSLRDAIITNTRATQECCKLALSLENCECFVHISTCYAFTQYDTILEEVYPPVADWRKCIELAEKCDEHTLQIVMGRFMEGFRNTYTFSKSLAENCVNDLMEGKMRHIILRPSIVVSTMQEPVTGWLDNFQGPNTIYLLSGLGMIRITYVGDIKFDFLPADFCIKSFIGVLSSKMNESVDSSKTDVYNVSVNDKFIVYQYELAAYLVKLSQSDLAFRDVIWYPQVTHTTSYTVYYFKSMFYQVIPALLFDGVLKLTTGRTKLFKIQKLVFSAVQVLSYYSLNEWNFVNDKIFALDARLHEVDRAAFGAPDFDTIDYKTVLRNMFKGVKKYLMKEDLNVTYTRKMWILFTLHWAVKLTFYYMVCSFIYHYILVRLTSNLFASE